MYMYTVEVLLGLKLFSFEKKKKGIRTVLRERFVLGRC